ncbi:hypothetical protein PN836_008310 [Ningiella sp. W23]|uniref:hypothetical protein n=1 Tax=Ningiella sp. W23 TaxID=3023715 RepID=UPI00375735A6
MLLSVGFNTSAFAGESFEINAFLKSVLNNAQTFDLILLERAGEAPFQLAQNPTQNLSSMNDAVMRAPLMNRSAQLGFRWGVSQTSDPRPESAYSVLLGYVQANELEVNIGFASLHADQRLLADEFYEGTWYAGFSAKF